MKFCKRCYVTLVEILLVLTLLVVVAGVVSIATKRALDEQKFRSEVNLVVNKLRFAQDLMLVYKGDVEVHFEEDANKLVDFWLTTQHLPEGLWKREIEHKHKLNFLILIEHGLNHEAKPGQLHLMFKSNGSFMSRGFLRIAAKEQNAGALVRYIVLNGYPHSIIDTASHPDNFAGDAAREENADASLTKLVIEEMRDNS